MGKHNTMSVKKDKTQAIIYSPELVREKIYRRIMGNKSDLTTRLLEKAKNSFDISPPAIALERLPEVKVLVYPQDPLVSEPEIMKIPTIDIQTNLTNDQFRIQDPLAGSARPNDEGNYIYEVGSPEFDQINSFFYSTRTLRMFEKYLHRTLPWGFEGKRLTINPHAGNDANAYYSEEEQQLALFSFPINGKEIRTSQSPDIVSHEAGHAILDSLRDLYNESFGYASGGIHESFGDIAAILGALQNRTLINKLLDMTQGNLRQDNLISALAEEFGKGVHAIDQDPRNNKVFYLRNAFNDFTDIPFEELEYLPRDEITTLGSEGHNYSRLLTGAFYDILVGIYEQLSEQLGRPGALSQACDIAGRIFARGVELGAVGETLYSDLARSLLDADRIYFNGKYEKVLIAELSQRKILSKNEADKHLTSRKKIPSVHLPVNMSSPEAANRFINSNKQKLGIPQGVELFVMNGYNNNDGLTFLNYFQSQRVTLSGEQFGSLSGKFFDIYGGVSLMFDRNRKLANYCTRLSTNTDIRQVKDQLARMVENGEFDRQSVSAGLPVLKLPVKSITKGKLTEKDRVLPIVQAMVVRTADGDLKIIRHPTHVDVINPTVPGMREFVKIWEKKYSKNKRGL
jgi:hypothetical protein